MNCSISFFAWILLWILIIILFIISICHQSLLLFGVIFLFAFILVIVFMIAQSGNDQEIPFSSYHSKKDFRHQHDNYQPPFISEDFAHPLHPTQENLISGNLPGTEIEDPETEIEDPNAPFYMERSLENLAKDNLYANVRAQNKVLDPNNCNSDPLPCEMRVAWEPTFVGCPSVFVNAPSCNLYNKYKPARHKTLNDMIEQRAIINGEQWDFYKHYNARQKLAQFISEDMVHRKDHYTRTVEDIDQSQCYDNPKLDTEAQ